MKRTILSLAIATILSGLAGCDTLRSYGMGGQPELRCKRSGDASLDDRLLGSDDVHLSMVRKAKDPDGVCAAFVKAAPAAYPQAGPTVVPLDLAHTIRMPDTMPQLGVTAIPAQAASAAK